MRLLVAGGVGKVVHVSTDEVYGSIAEGSWAEGSPLDPNSPYAATKAGGDLIALAYARTHGLDVSITRCCNNYDTELTPDGLKATIAWYAGNRQWWEPLDRPAPPTGRTES